VSIFEIPLPAVAGFLPFPPEADQPVAETGDLKT